MVTKYRHCATCIADDITSFPLHSSQPLKTLQRARRCRPLQSTNVQIQQACYTGYVTANCE